LQAGGDDSDADEWMEEMRQKEKAAREAKFGPDAGSDVRVC
jgi:hypothetical protein